MSTEETLYTARMIGVEALEAGRTQTLTCPVYRNGALVAPSSGTITVYDASNVAIVSAAAITVTASVATYSLASTLIPTTMVYGNGWRIEFALLMPDSVVHTFRRDGALVRRRLYPVVTDTDLFRLHSDLSAVRPSGASSYQDYLDEAWAQIDSRLAQNARRPWLIMEPSALRNVHLFGTLAIIFRDFMTGSGEGGRWEALASHYEQKYTTEWDALTFTYDDTNSGQANKRKAAGVSSVFLSSGTPPGLRPWRINP